MARGLNVKRTERLVLAMSLALIASVGRAEELRDPTRPARLGPGIVMVAPGVEAVRLEAILSQGDTRRAIVNGKVVREGDRVAGVQVTAILGNSIHYLRAGREHVAILPTQRIPVRRSGALQAGEP